MDVFKLGGRIGNIEDFIGRVGGPDQRMYPTKFASKMLNIFEFGEEIDFEDKGNIPFYSMTLECSVDENNFETSPEQAKIDYNITAKDLEPIIDNMHLAMKTQIQLTLKEFEHNVFEFFQYNDEQIVMRKIAQTAISLTSGNTSIIKNATVPVRTSHLVDIEDIEKLLHEYERIIGSSKKIVDVDEPTVSDKYTR